MSCSLLLACTYKIYNALRSENLEAEFLLQCRAFAQQCAFSLCCTGCMTHNGCLAYRHMQRPSWKCISARIGLRSSHMQCPGHAICHDQSPAPYHAHRGQRRAHCHIFSLIDHTVDLFGHLALCSRTHSAARGRCQVQAGRPPARAAALLPGPMGALPAARVEPRAAHVLRRHALPSMQMPVSCLDGILAMGMSNCPKLHALRARTQHLQSLARKVCRYMLHAHVST